MGDWPTEEEEFELMYGDEMDLLREHEDEDFNVLPTNPRPARKTLNFNSSPENTTKSNFVSQTNNSFEDGLSGISSQLPSRKSPNKVSGTNEFTTGNTQNSAPLFTETLENEVSGHNLSDINTSLDTGSSQSRKRTTEDLFGDINDIILDEQLNHILSQPKKQKTDETAADLKLISQIIQLRKENRTKHALLPSKNYNINVSDNIERDKRNISLRVPKYPFLGITTHNGARVYVRFHSEDYEKEDTVRLLGESKFFGVGAFENMWRDARELVGREVSSISEPMVTEIELLEEKNDKVKELWVELYKPRKYYELLSDESTNRIMLRWMKLWDKVVFKRNPKIKPILNTADDKQNFFKRYELNTTLDEYGRPEHKVALLCGAPGLGKTTLAHMVAHHAGYNVVEVNASDDRTVENFKKKLENATQMRSVIDKEQRPNCIVFDEIDGAPQASIDFLVKYITGTSTKAKKGGKKAQQEILKRPVICICNDVYVPALRPLRQIAFVVNFPKTSSARLAERLMEIARRQQIKTDLGAMLALAEKSNHDVRSCLSVLHFFKAQNKPIGLSDVYRANVGQKDMQRGLFSVWQDIFEIKRSKNQNGTLLAQPKERMENVLQTMSSFGDHERVAQGIYENFPLLSQRKFTVMGARTALDWFVFNDILLRQIYGLQNYTMTSYLNYAFVIWHFVFGSLQRVKLVYPSAGYEARSKEIRRNAIVQEVLRGMTAAARSNNQALSLLLDVLPLVVKIIVPPLRPVNMYLYTEEEKTCFLRVVGVMIDYNLNYVQERTSQGSYQFNLEPNIEEIVIFKSLKEVKRRHLSYSNKQLIAREIMMEKARRVEAQMVKNQPVKEKEKPSEKPLPNHLQTLRGKLSDVKESKQQTRNQYLLLVLEKTRKAIRLSDPTLEID